MNNKDVDNYLKHKNKRKNRNNEVKIDTMFGNIAIKDNSDKRDIVLEGTTVSDNSNINLNTNNNADVNTNANTNTNANNDININSNVDANANVNANANKQLFGVKDYDKHSGNVLQVKKVQEYDEASNEVVLSFSFDNITETTTINKSDFLILSQVEKSLDEEFDSYFEQLKKDAAHLKERQDKVIKEVVKIVDTNELEDEQVILDFLLEQLNNLRKELQVLEESINFDNIYKFGNKNFSDLINKYVSILNNDDIIVKQMDTVRKSKAYLEIDKTLRELEDDNSKVSTFCKIKMNEYENRDKDFFIEKGKIEEIDDITKSVTKLIEEEEKIIKDMDAKLKNAVSEVEHVEYTIESSNHALRNLIMAVASSNLIQNKGLKTAVLVGETFRFINAMMNPRLKEEKTIKLEVIDYSDEIKRATEDVSLVEKQLFDMKGQVMEIFTYFDKNFSEYLDVIPEYKYVLEQLQMVSDIIDEQYSLVTNNNDNLERQYRENYEKVKLKQDFN